MEDMATRGNNEIPHLATVAKHIPIFSHRANNRKPATFTKSPYISFTKKHLYIFKYNPIPRR